MVDGSDPTHRMWSRSGGNSSFHLRVWKATHPEISADLLDWSTQTDAPTVCEPSEGDSSLGPR